MATNVQALFLDRDGTLIENPHSFRERVGASLRLERMKAVLLTPG